MFTTYKMMSSVVAGEVDSYDIQKLVQQYKVTSSSREKNKIVAVIFCKFFPLILRVQKTYSTLTNEQKVETCLSYIFYSLEGYKTNNKVKFITYCIGNIKRGLQTVQNSQNCFNRRVWLNLVQLKPEHLDFVLEKVPDKSNTCNYIRLVSEIKNSELLTESEKKYCLSALYGFKHKKDFFNNSFNSQEYKQKCREITKVRNSVRKKLKANNFSFS